MAWNRAALTVLLVCAAAGSATIARYPYVQNVSETRATIVWTTVEEGRGVVEYSSDGEQWRSARASGKWFPAVETGLGYSYFQHEAELTGLRAATLYFYRIRVDGDPIASLSSTLQFRTAGPVPFRFLVFGDSGNGSPEQWRVAGRMSNEIFDFVLHTGDVVYPVGAFIHYQPFYFDPYAAMLLRAPFFPVLGNHDYETNSGAPYLATHVLPVDNVPESGRERYYSFDWGNAHFVALDTNASLISASRGEGPMLKWLDADLAATRKFWRIVYFHHSAYATGIYENDARTDLVREQIAPILERHNVHLAFHGHEHNYQRTQPIREGSPAVNGTVYITTGGGGAGLYAVYATSRIAYGIAAHHYVRVRADGAVMTLEAVRDDGAILDRLDLVPPPRLAPRAVVNGASFEPALAPGALASIFGVDLAAESLTAANPSIPLDLGVVRVTLDGQRLPLTFVSPSQINTQLPYNATGQSTLRVSTPNGSVEATVTIGETAPGIFLVGGRPAATHADGTLITPQSPAMPGERISIYLTGLGRVNGAISAGQRAPSQPLMTARAPVEVEIGGVRIEPAFAGLAPGYAGLYQIDAVVPNLEPGPQPLNIRAGAAKSPVTTLAVGR